MHEPLEIDNPTLYEVNDLAVLRQIEDALSLSLKEIVTLPETRLKWTLKVYQIMDEIITMRKRIRMDIKDIKVGTYREINYD
jgi:hypothetical protein